MKRLMTGCVFGMMAAGLAMSTSAANESKSKDAAQTPSISSAAPQTNGPSVNTKLGGEQSLAPYRAITLDRILHSGMYGDYTGHAVPKDKDHCFLVVYFKTKAGTKSVDASQMTWKAKLKDGTEVAPIGFGIPQGDNPVRMFGVLAEGGVTANKDAPQSMLALIYVVAKKANEFTLLAPNGIAQDLTISKDWKPGEEPTITGTETGAKIRTSGGGQLWEVITN